MPDPDSDRQGIGPAQTLPKCTVYGHCFIEMSDWAHGLAGEGLKMSHGTRTYDGRYFQGNTLGRGSSKLKYLSIPALMQVLHELDDAKCPSQSVSHRRERSIRDGGRRQIRAETRKATLKLNKLEVEGRGSPRSKWSWECKGREWTTTWARIVPDRPRLPCAEREKRLLR